MRKERGSVSIVVAALVGAVMVLMLGAVDLARVLTASAVAQTAADAAALAAAQELALPSGAEPADVAAGFAASNGATLLTCTCPEGGLEAIVEVRVDVGPMLLVGDGRSVSATARAVVDAGGP